jgi:chemotaxis protein methyltransferase CheR
MTHATARKPTKNTISSMQDIADLVSGITGVQLGERQKGMVESRLKKRMLELKLSDDRNYFSYFQDNSQSETEELVSLLTTHHTYFFREFAHFEYLEKEGLPRLLKAMKERGDSVLRVWSAACSNGQEVYSLSMFLQYTLARMAPGVKFEILGTDVAAQSVAIAKNGVYAYKEIKELPMHFLSNHWAKGTGEISNFVKAKRSIKDPCTFGVFNLLDAGKSQGLGDKKFDLIFCRNVFIYFTPEQIKVITENLLKHLLPQGVLVIGISESLNGLNIPVTAAGTSVYVHKSSPPLVGAPLPSVMPAMLRVLCVDDSPSILTLLKQVLKKEHGFEVVGTAGNGKEAFEKIKELKPDVMTLDIHMPEMDGIEYLQKNGLSHLAKEHPPIVMISSVSRESSELALKALELGATDYVEKPALSNLNERAEEIRIKLSYAYRNRKEGVSAAQLSLDRSFTQLPTINHADKKLRIALGGLQDRKRLQELLKNSTGPQPATIVLMEGSESALPSLAAQWLKDTGKKVELIQAWPMALTPGQVYLGDFGKYWDAICASHREKRTSILIYGVLSEQSTLKISQWPKKSAQVLIEDSTESTKNRALSATATDQVPATSFAYMSSEFLGLKNE